jgi:hypothetical protein
MPRRHTVSESQGARDVVITWTPGPCPDIAEPRVVAGREESYPAEGEPGGEVGE